MDRVLIEKKARELQREIWHGRTRLFPSGEPPPRMMLQPEVAAEVLGIAYHLSDGLGSWGEGRDRFEVAGLLDRGRKVIEVSLRFSYVARRFTGAHEVGHLMLEHRGPVLHRDRPVVNLHANTRDPVEREADYFAACFLAPERLVVKAYRARFMNRALPLTHAVAYNLRGENGVASLMNAGSGSYQFAAAVASARAFNGARFDSLADLFGVSVSAMAVRLRELGLVEG